MSKLYKNKEWLEKAIKENDNNKQIGEQIGVSGDTISYWRKKFGLPKSQAESNVNRTYSINKEYFDVIDTEHKAYWLGFIMADGCICKTESKGKYNRLCFTIKDTDINLLELFQIDLESNYPIKIKININKKLDFETTICELRISSAYLVNSLMKHGISPNKTGKENIPNSVPKELIRHFIRGFFDGDGCIASTKKLSIGCSSKLIIKQINQHINSELNINFSIHERTEYSVPFFLIDSNHYKNNKIFLDYIYNNASVYLDRKYKIYLNMYCQSAPLYSDV